MKKELGGHHFARDDDVKNAIDHFLRDQNDTIYKEGIYLLHECWIKYVNVGGDPTQWQCNAPLLVCHVEK